MPRDLSALKIGESVHVRAMRDINAETDDGIMRFVASTEDVARDGLIIEADAWRFDNFDRNPVFLWAHDYSQPPIGRVVEREITQRGLEIGVEWAGTDAGREIGGLYRDGFLNAVSVGWRTHKIEFSDDPAEAPRIKEAELLEVSGVPVPADPGAVAVGRAVAGAPIETVDSWALGWIKARRLGEPETTPHQADDLQVDTLARIADAAEYVGAAAGALADLLSEKRTPADDPATNKPEENEAGDPVVLHLVES